MKCKTNSNIHVGHLSDLSKLSTGFGGKTVGRGGVHRDMGMNTLCFGQKQINHQDIKKCTNGFIE